MTRLYLRTLATPAALLFAACGKEPEPEPLPEQPTLAPGAACDPDVIAAAETDDPEDDKDPQAVCAPGLACEPVIDSDDFVCGAALRLRGRVRDSLTGIGIDGALIAALNEIGEPVTDIAVSDSCGAYDLPISVRRKPDGSFAEPLRWTLTVSARDYQPFPTGLRPALPIDLGDAQPNPDGVEPPRADDRDEPMATHAYEVIDNAATSVALIPLGDAAKGVSIAGSVGPDAAGALVVAEGPEAPAPYAIADASGDYVLFNVQPGAVTVRAYRQNVESTPAAVSVAGTDLVDVDLALASRDPAALATIDGAINIVNAPGGSLTSVVLVPASVYNAALERGPVPLGLRDPPPPATPDVTGGFTISGVPGGTYKVLVAFENDLLVRDPDAGIAGTQIQEITVEAGQPTTLAESFKVTEALAIVGPGRDAPEEVEANPTLVWADDSGEDGYSIVVFDALGTNVWSTELPGTSGSDTVELPYAGPALTPGMYYQFRVTAWREVKAERLNTSRSEDLRGVFFHGEAPPEPDCVAEASGGSSGGSSGGGESTN